VSFPNPSWILRVLDDLPFFIRDFIKLKHEVVNFKVGRGDVAVEVGCSARLQAGIPVVP
jgi:hypothetical protein